MILLILSDKNFLKHNTKRSTAIIFLDENLKNGRCFDNKIIMKREEYDGN